MEPIPLVDPNLIQDQLPVKGPIILYTCSIKGYVYMMMKWPHQELITLNEPIKNMGPIPQMEPIPAMEPTPVVIQLQQFQFHITRPWN